MINYLLRKIFFSKAMKKIRDGYRLEWYYQGQNDQIYDDLHKGLEKK